MASSNKDIGLPVGEAKRAPRGRPRKIDEADRHNRILAHALDEFTTHGFSGTSMESIARRAQISKMTLYKYFGNKEGLFRALGLKASRPVQERVAAVATAGRPVADTLRDFARAIQYQERDHLAFGMLRLAVFEQHRFPLIAAAVYQSGLDTLTPLLRYMDGLIADGALRQEDPEEAMVQFCALVTRGHRFLLVDDVDHVALDQFIERSVALFLRGMAADGIAKVRPDIDSN
ncbi:transcriptional regulator [Sphingobium sp. C100]|jgi:AcrR family transcriptional regulator|uniref:TetR/AcrR family transcriptional regulator n=1 Tax=Sphingobium sp. C100 TaxID=1207055 RepID=UPI0003D5F43E|nr:TetR/AcrR family transcriptional regulator [Sphingobium sp. C100]ETI64219.1 transcriptional regulator [Sphingobium sp. C100]